MEKGNLDIWGTLTINNSAVLRVTGNLTIHATGELVLKNSSKLLISGDLTQTGALSVVGDINANKAFVIIEGDYKIDGANRWTNTFLDPSKNDVYVFGENDLSEVGISTTKLKDQNDFIEEHHASSISEFLPIELTSFTATATKNGFEFNWITASEVENDYFTLEYSIDGVDFNEIDYVHGAGTTSETSEYEYRWDEAPEFDVVYFRLKQTDYNGEYSYSDVIVASRKKSSGANGTFRYGPLNLQIQDGELRYIVK